MPKETASVESPTVKSNAELKFLDPKQLYHSENPRKSMSKTGLDELKESIRSVGILAPILCYYSSTNKVTIISGHRRTKAAIELGMDTVPVIYIKTDNNRAAEAAIIENIQREDLEPLDEAYAMKDIQANRKLTVAELSLRCGKSEAYVYRRLRLLELPDLAKKALKTGELSLQGAVILLRIQQKELLKQAAKYLFTGPRAPDLRDIQDCVDSYTNQLSKAPFSIKDAELFKKAGACTNCPKRSSTQVRLFDDVEKKDHCLDATCWREKVKRSADGDERVLVAAGAKVVKPIPAGAHKQHDGSVTLGYSSPVVDLHASCDGDFKRRTYKNLLGKDFNPKNATLYREKDGTLRIWIKKDTAWKQIKAKGIKLSSPYGTSSSSRKPTSQEKAARVLAGMKEKAKTAAQREAIDLVAYAVAPRFSLKDTKALGILLAQSVQATTVRMFCQKHEIGPKKNPFGSDYKRHLANYFAAEVSHDDAAHLIVELLLMETVETWNADAPTFLRVIKLYGVNIKKLRAKSFKDLQKAKAKKQKAKPKKKAKAKRSKSKLKK